MRVLVDIQVEDGGSLYLSGEDPRPALLMLNAFGDSEFSATDHTYKVMQKIYNDHFATLTTSNEMFEFIEWGVKNLSKKFLDWNMNDVLGLPPQNNRGF